MVFAAQGPRRTSFSAQARTATPVIALLLLISGADTSASAQVSSPANPSQVLILKDPTPRDPDPELLYNEPTSGTPQAQHAAIALNEQRQLLITRASGELTELASALKSGIAAHRAGTSLAPELQVSEMIEKLARNVKNSMELGAGAGDTLRAGESSKTAKDPPPETSLEGQLSADADKLFSLAQQLQTEVSRTNRDTLSVSVLSKSAQVERQAKILKGKLKKNING